MANISSIGGNPIVPAAVQEGSVTDAMLAQTGGVYSQVYDVQPITLPQDLPTPQRVKVDVGSGGSLYYGTHNVIALVGIEEVSEYEYEGMKVTVSGNTVTVKGTATATVQFCVQTGKHETAADIATMSLGLPEQLYTLIQTVTQQNGSRIPPFYVRKSDNSGQVASVQGNSAQFTASSACGGMYFYCQSGLAYDLTFVIALIPWATTQGNVYRTETSEVEKIDASGVYEVGSYMWASDNVVSAALVASRMDKAARKCLLRYDQRTISYTGAVEVLDVYLPCAVGYAHVIFAHTTSDNTNADVWRIVQVTACSDTLAELFNITAFGETEMAVKIQGRDDFIGGWTHGDEISVSGSVVFLIDGLATDVTALEGMVKFDTMTVFETTDMFDPSDHETQVGTHGKQWTFTANGIELTQVVEWAGAYTLDESYMPMVCAIRGNDIASELQVTDTYTDDGSLLPYDVGTAGFTTYPNQFKTDVSRMHLWSEDSGVHITCTIEKQPVLEGHGCYVYNSANTYNKLYNTICGRSTSHTTQAGEKWQTRAHLKFEVG